MEDIRDSYLTKPEVILSENIGSQKDPGNKEKTKEWGTIGDIFKDQPPLSEQRKGLQR